MIDDMLNANIAAGDGTNGVPPVLNDDKEEGISFDLLKKSVGLKSFATDLKEPTDLNINLKSVSKSNMKLAKMEENQYEKDCQHPAI